MKKLLLFIALALPLLALTQPAGRIVYQEKINLHRGLGPDQEEHKALVPEWQTSKTVLLYDGQASLYKAMGEEGEGEINHEEGGAQVNIRIQRGSNALYRNYPENRQVEVRDFMGKKFLIDMEMEGREWKIMPEEKTINGDVCQLAAFTNEEGVEVVAWFAPSIPTPIGPGEFYGLPGAILMVDVDNGRRLYEAVQVDLQGEAPVIEVPNEGKKIDKADYDKMVEERMREMGGSGRHGIRIIRQ